MALATLLGLESRLEVYPLRSRRAIFRPESSYSVSFDEASRLSAAMIPQSVLIPPGSIRQTLIPKGLTYMRSASLRASTEYFETLYHPPNGITAFPATDEVLIIVPECCLRIYGRTSWVRRANPKTFTSS